MTCDELTDLTRWDCFPAGDCAIRVVTPMTLGDDGQHLAFYVATLTDGSFFLTDAGETAMHAEQLGVELKKPHIAQLNAVLGVRHARFNANWEITAEGANERLSWALWDAVKLGLALSFQHHRWLPKFHAQRFKQQVEHALLDHVTAEELIQTPETIGMSGHALKFPLGLRLPGGRLAYIEPIAAQDNQRMDWPHIYQAAGKMSDIKWVDDTNPRWVILEESDAPGEYGKAATLLSQYAQVGTIPAIPHTVRNYLLAA